MLCCMHFVSTPEEDFFILADIMQEATAPPGLHLKAFHYKQGPAFLSRHYELGQLHSVLQFNVWMLFPLVQIK